MADQKIVAIVQARLGSTRLPGKVMRTIEDMPMIDLLLTRLERSKRLDSIIVATSVEATDDPLAVHLSQCGRPVFRGSEADVLSRFYGAAAEIKADICVRITGDCPLIDPQLVDQVINLYTSSNADYVSNIDPPTYPDGLDVEVFSFASLQQAHNDATTAYDREHVTPYLRTHDGFSRMVQTHDADLSSMRFTVDEAEDLAIVKQVFAHFAPDRHFSWQDVVNLAQTNPELFSANQKFQRNEGASMSEGQKLWGRAKRSIPGGNMLLSKRPEMFLPEKWPTYFDTAIGCEVTDLDGARYTDMALMGVGTNILGYANSEVNAAVTDAISKGTMSSLNCPEEVLLAERLIEINPWADMVRLARAGGEANAIAIRIARAASGRDGVAVCGYHGWHDWYLSANLGDTENLAGHLLPGLDPAGVPQSLRGVVHPFMFNDIDALEKIIATQDIGVIKMEVMRNDPPAPGFLERIRALATEKNIVLVFDECTSGFRETFGGLYKKFGVEPDMAVYGKTLGNGFAITAVVGRGEVMDAAQSTFISSTFWTERVGPVAALKALEVIEREQAWDTITATGNAFKRRLDDLASAHDLTINHAGLPAITTYSFASDNALSYKTLITQEMLKKGFLATTGLYACVLHTDQMLSDYFDALDPIYAAISKCEKGEEDVGALLEGPVCHGGFKRLN